MKMRLLLALVGLTIGFVGPVFAQEKEEVNPKILTAIQANDKAYDDAFNKHDAAGIAALFSENAVLVIRWGGGGGDSTPSPGDTIDGVFTGRAGVEKRYAALFKLRHFEDHLNTLDQDQCSLSLSSKSAQISAEVLRHGEGLIRHLAGGIGIHGSLGGR